MIQGMASDLRYVVRVLRRSPGFTLVAVLSLALGIGANTVMFGVVRTLLLTPLPVDAPDELALVTWHRDGDFDVNQTGATSYAHPGGGPQLSSNLSYPLYQALKEAAPRGVDLFAFAFLRGVSVVVGDQPALFAGGALVDGRYFSALRVPMALGRGIGLEDDRPDAPLVAVLSHSFWLRSFGGDPSVLGRTVRVNGTPAEVVGVTAEGFRGMSMGGFFPPTEITLPLASQPRVYARMGSDLFTAENQLWLRVAARVPPGPGRGDLEGRFAAVLRSHPSPLAEQDGHSPEVRLISAAHGAQPVRAETARLLWLLQGVVAIVLLIACVNLASLMLARGVSRQREMAVRRALGGGRARLVRQSLLESLLLAGAGTAAGLALTLVGRRFLGELLTGSLGAGAFGSVDMRVGVDPAVVAVSVVLGLVATVISGLLPALRLSGLDPVAWLRHRAAGASTPRLTFGRALIALQVAVSVPLVVGAALFLRTLHNLGSVDLGFDPRGVVTFQLDPGYTKRASDEYPRLYLEVLESVRALPGVRSATLLENALMSGVVSNGTIELDGREHMLYRNAVGPDFLETLGMRLLAGRGPGVQDDRSAPRVAAVNETAVRTIFGGVSPVGRILPLRGGDVEIVGVVGDTPYRSQRDSVPATLYESALQREGWGGHHVVLRIDAPLGSVEPLVREAVARVDPDLPVPEIRSQTAIMEQTSAKERVFTKLLGLFGGFALLLATIGLHGVTAYAVSRRTSEIGVRVAVGARPSQVLWLVLRQVVGLAAVGVALGVPGALAAGPLVASLLYGVAPTDPATVASAAAVMLTVALAAGALPALRAVRLDPLAALRTE